MNRAVSKSAVRLSRLTLLGLSVLLAACLAACQPIQPVAPTDPAAQATAVNGDLALTPANADSTQTGDTTIATAEQSGSTAIPVPDTIEWQRDPRAMVFRAEISGGDAPETPETAYIRNEVPPCTLYGDNRLVWTTTNLRTDDTVVFDMLTDDVVRAFITRLITDFNFYGYAQGVQTSDDSGEIPVVERLTLTINGQTYVTDSFSGWGYTYFRDVLDDCRSLSSTPIAFEPQGAWVTVRNMGYNPNRPSLYWDAAANGLTLADLANSTPQWMTGAPMVLLWRTIRDGGIDILLQENGTDYLVTVEVPNITRSSAAAPAS